MHIFSDATSLTSNVWRWFQKTFMKVFPPQVVKDTVNIQIGDVNDNAPIFHGQPYTVHIPEVRLMGSLLVICKGMQVGLHQ